MSNKLDDRCREHVSCLLEIVEEAEEDAAKLRELLKRAWTHIDGLVGLYDDVGALARVDAVGGWLDDYDALLEENGDG
jgi:hypothetical protein